MALVFLMADAMASNGPEGSSSRIRRVIENLGPYQSLALLLVPICIVEPMKLAAVALAGDGHWFTGTVVIIVAYGTSLLLVERLFKIVKPKLLKLRWFARISSSLIRIRYRLMKPLRGAG
jgi:hypothetical protein